MPQDDAADRLQAKLQALRNLKAANFYDQKLDNPENLDLNTGQPQQAMPAQRTPEQAAMAGSTPPSPSPQTMQANPQNLLDALNRKKQLDDQLNAAGLPGMPQNNGQ